MGALASISAGGGSARGMPPREANSATSRAGSSLTFLPATSISAAEIQFVKAEAQFGVAFGQLQISGVFLDVSLFFAPAGGLEVLAERFENGFSGADRYADLNIVGVALIDLFDNAWNRDGDRGHCLAPSELFFDPLQIAPDEIVLPKLAHFFL